MLILGVLIGKLYGSDSGRLDWSCMYSCPRKVEYYLTRDLRLKERDGTRTYQLRLLIKTFSNWNFYGRIHYVTIFRKEHELGREPHNFFNVHCNFECASIFKDDTGTWAWRGSPSSLARPTWAALLAERAKVKRYVHIFEKATRQTNNIIDNSAFHLVQAMHRLA